MGRMAGVIESEEWCECRTRSGRVACGTPNQSGRELG
jgi:hypothetical protein